MNQKSAGKIIDASDASETFKALAAQERLAGLMLSQRWERLASLTGDRFMLIGKPTRPGYVEFACDPYWSEMAMYEARMVLYWRDKENEYRGQFADAIRMLAPTMEDMKKVMPDLWNCLVRKAHHEKRVAYWAWKIIKAKWLQVNRMSHEMDGKVIHGAFHNIRHKPTQDTLSLHMGQPVQWLDGVQRITVESWHVPTERKPVMRDARIAKIFGSGFVMVPNRRVIKAADKHHSEYSSDKSIVHAADRFYNCVAELAITKLGLRKEDVNNVAKRAGALRVAMDSLVKMSSLHIQQRRVRNETEMSKPIIIEQAQPAQWCYEGIDKWKHHFITDHETRIKEIRAKDWHVTRIGKPERPLWRFHVYDVVNGQAEKLGCYNLKIQRKAV